MSRGLVCDRCGEVLKVNHHGEDADGESASWIKVSTTFGEYDLCTRACVVALVESDDFAAEVDAGAEAIAEVTRTLTTSEADDPEESP